MTDERWGRVGLALWHLFPVVFDGLAVAGGGTVAHEEQIDWKAGRAPTQPLRPACAASAEREE